MTFVAAGRAWLARWKPARSPHSRSERGIAWLGALFGLFCTGLVTRSCFGAGEQVPLLIAPIGASTVLVFGVPASPLAQPWSVIGGNGIAALVGVTAAHFIQDPFLAGAVAVASTIWLTSWLGCLHPPAGAVALTAVIGGPVIAAAGYRFALMPVAVNSTLLVAMGLLFNNLASRSYPHVATVPVSKHRTLDSPPEFRLGFAEKDIDQALARLETPLDVERADILALFRHVEEAAHERLQGVIVCGEIMSRDLVTIGPDELATRALERLREHALRVLPVLDVRGRVLSVIDVASAASAPFSRVGDLPSIHFELANPETPIDRVLPLLSNGHVHEAMIVDARERLIGVITQTDLLAVVGRLGRRAARPLSAESHAGRRAASLPPQ